MPFGSVFRLNLTGHIRMLISRKIVCFLSFTNRALTTQVLLPLSATYYTIGRPIVCTSVLPLRCREIVRKRVAFHLLLSPPHLRDSTPIYDRPLEKQPLFDIPHVTPPYGFEVGESLRASTA
jgi:hypothetical protein